VQYNGHSIHVSGWARRFHFNVDQLATRISNLSGGEQARVVIANLTLLPADILLLDEPTNDLDIPSLEVLEQALLEFSGSIVLVTHDRFLLERISTEYLALDGRGQGRRFVSIEQWAAASMKSEQAQQAGPSKPSMPASTQNASAQNATGKPTKLSYKLQLEYDSMEESILAAEERAEKLEQEAGEPGLVADHVRAAAVYSKLKDAQARVAELYARWSELESMQGGR
jgi:ATP-binding cassette subfamily F protein uup